MAYLEKLELLRTTKKEIRTAIEEKGQEVGEIPFSQYPEKIRAIAGGGAADEEEILAAILDGSIGTMEIPPVSKIRSYAFQNCANLALTRLPEGLTTIGAYAFQNCAGLALARLPEGLTTIGNYAFQKCASLALTSLPDSLEDIGQYAFSFCASLALTTFPANLTTIAINTFNNCTSLTELLIPATVTSIGNAAFAGCTKLKKVTFLGKTRLAKEPFSRCTGMTINVPWAKGEVAGAPWGATSSTINYNYTEE